MDPYAGFARDYDWLYSDFQQIGDRNVEGLEPELALLESPRILDCACGTGLLTLALARRGYEVAGTDASTEMVAQARTRAERDGLRLDLSPCDWKSLPQHFGREFDLVTCCGNSIGHCRSESEMVEALTAMRKVLRPAGRLILDSRNWETLLSERVRFTCFGPRERDGERCVPLYVWSFPDAQGQPVTVEVVFPIERDGNVTLHSYSVTYHPFTAAQLAQRLDRAGFVDTRVESRGSAFLHAVATRPPLRPAE